MTSSGISISKAFGDIPSRRELEHLVCQSQTLQGGFDVISCDVMATVSWRKTMSVFFPKGGPPTVAYENKIGGIRFKSMVYTIKVLLQMLNA